MCKIRTLSHDYRLFRKYRKGMFMPVVGFGDDFEANGYEQGKCCFFPKKMIFVKLLSETFEDQPDNDWIEDEINANFPDILGVNETHFQKMCEKYPDHIFNFNDSMPTKGGINITDDCQLRCTYCSYCSGEGSRAVVSEESIKAFVDMLIKNITKKKAITKEDSVLEILIAGGGEPTFKWSRFVYAVEYIKAVAQKHGINYDLNITTNGCLSEEQAEYIANNFKSVLISFDGTPSIQNKNRPYASGESSFEIVNKTIKYFDSIDFNYRLRSVVWYEDYYYKVNDMADFIFENYKNIKGWDVRPVMAWGRATNKDNIERIRHIAGFTDVYHLLLRHVKNPELVSLISSNIAPVRTFEMFCGALYGSHPWLLTNDNIVTCMDAKEDAVLFGNIKNGVVNLNTAKEIYAEKSLDYMNECEGCFAYYFCCAGCPLKRNNKEIYEYSDNECYEIRNYWIKTLVRLWESNVFDGWVLTPLEFNDIPDVEVYRIERG